MEVKYINIILSIFSISAPQIPKRLIWYQLLWLKILNIKQCGILNTFWANSITIMWVKMGTNPPMFWLVKEWVVKSPPLFFSKLRQPTHGSYRRIIMLEKCGHPDLNVFSPQMNNRHPWKLKKSKSWGLFWSYQLNSTANSAHLAQLLR